MSSQLKIMLGLKVKRFSTLDENERKIIRKGPLYNQRLRLFFEEHQKKINTYTPYLVPHEQLLQTSISLTDNFFLELDDQAEKLDNDLYCAKWAIGFWFDEKGNAFRFSKEKNEWEIVTK